MTETILAQAVGTKADQWRERIAEQERTVVSVKQFCKQHGLTDSKIRPEASYGI